MSNSKIESIGKFIAKPLAITIAICMFIIIPIAILGAIWYILAPVLWYEKFFTLIISLILPVIYEIIVLFIITVIYN